MFRDGQYLEVIKAADDCLATAVVTVQEKTVEIKDRKVITNKWLKIEDWAALYKILARAILQNGRDDAGSHLENRGCEWRKSIRQLDVTYTFEHSESASSAISLPTIKVHVSPARKKPMKRKPNDETSKSSRIECNADGMKRTREKSPDRTTDVVKSDRSKKMPEKTKQIPATAATARNNKDPKKMKSRKYRLCEDLENAPLEEYIPDAPTKAKRSCPDFKYVPSRKSTLEGMRVMLDEYTPTERRSDSERAMTESANYVPNSVGKLDVVHEMYEPCATTVIPDAVLAEYVPNSKGARPAVEEYEPDFKSPCNQLTFDDSYVPSSVHKRATDDSTRKTPEAKLTRRPERRKEKLRKKDGSLLVRRSFARN